jgi:hypothetical protein
MHSKKLFRGQIGSPPRFLMCINLDDFDSGYLEYSQGIQKLCNPKKMKNYLKPKA